VTPPGPRRGVGLTLAEPAGRVQPSVARMYDYWLGGRHHHEVDRAAADRVAQLLGSDPAIMARANRDFLIYAVEFCVTELGLRQFLDLGSGLPTVGNVHEIAQRLDPACRVVYVDFDPEAVAYSRQLLGDAAGVAVLEHDVRDPAAILADPRLRATLDLDQPAAVLMVALLHFVEGDVLPITEAFRDAVPAGSALVLTHGTGDPEVLEQGRRLYRVTNSSGEGRSPEEIRRLFDGWELLGDLLDIEHWKVPGARRPAWVAGGIATKPTVITSSGKCL
jgi:SAM-dependent methyltransferase